ncbi:MAG: hypothetical protein ACI4QH_04110 [Candidatus Fimimonas sp.]
MKQKVSKTFGKTLRNFGLNAKATHSYRFRTDVQNEKRVKPKGIFAKRWRQVFLQNVTKFFCVHALRCVNVLKTVNN